MRNTTKLKIILQNYNVDFSMHDEVNIVMTIFDKEIDDSEYFEDKSYSALISRAYSYANKQRKIVRQED